MEIRSVFEKIITREVPADIVAETDDLIVIKDIHPRAPIHLLIIPKRAIKDISSMEHRDAFLAGKIFLMAKELSQTIPGARDFRLVINNGSQVGQSVFHLHCHFLAGQKMSGL